MCVELKPKFRAGPNQNVKNIFVIRIENRGNERSFSTAQTVRSTGARTQDNVQVNANGFDSR